MTEVSEMRPLTPILYMANHRRVDAVLFRDQAVLSRSRKYSAGLFYGELLPVAVSFSDHVDSIVSGRSGKKMIGVYTRSVVTRVTHVVVRRNCAAERHVRKAMGCYIFALIGEQPIFCRVSTTHEFPAASVIHHWAYFPKKSMKCAFFNHASILTYGAVN